jgi:UDP-glucose 4-epimerase
LTSLAGSRVLVTGASGLIGGQILSLVENEADIVAVSRVPHVNARGVRWIVGDLTARGAVAEIVGSVRPEIILHLAGAVRGDRSLAAIAPTLSANLVATVELLQTASEMGSQRIVLSGSLLEEPATGGPEAVPPSPYGASRWAASSYARMFHALFDSPVVILRPSFAYGPGQETTKLIPYVITTLLAGGSPKLASGKRRLDCVYAEDVARAYLAAASAPNIEGRTSGRPLFGAVSDRPLEQEVEVDIERTARLLGWRASTHLKEGLARTVDWYRRRSSQPKR